MIDVVYNSLGLKEIPIVSMAHVCLTPIKPIIYANFKVTFCLQTLKSTHMSQIVVQISSNYRIINQIKRFNQSFSVEGQSHLLS